MRTRTLLLLAIGCGLVILAAGVVQLLRIAGQDDPPTAVEVGETASVADMSVTVREAGGDGDAFTVTIDIGGVDDPDGTAEFRLVVPGASIASDGGTCAATTTAIERCTLRFDVSDAEGTSRVLLYRRGDEQARWELG